MIDAHMHIGAWDHADFLGRACSLGDAARVMRECDLAGAAILPTDQCDNAGLLSDALSGVAGDRKLWLFGWMRPVDSEHGAQDLAWAAQNLSHIVGIKIHPSLSRVRITADGFRPALELAEKHGLLVLVHCGRWQEIASYRFAVEAAQRYPRARFLLAHAGGDTPPLASAACDLVAETAVKNVWFEFSGLREYWVIERNVRKLGAERYLMGSDFNLAHPRMYIGQVEGMNLPQADKEKILGGNALQLFGDSLGHG